MTCTGTVSVQVNICTSLIGPLSCQDSNTAKSQYSCYRASVFIFIIIVIIFFILLSTLLFPSILLYRRTPHWCTMQCMWLPWLCSSLSRSLSAHYSATDTSLGASGTASWPSSKRYCRCLSSFSLFCLPLPHTVKLHNQTNALQNWTRVKCIND